MCDGKININLPLYYFLITERGKIMKKNIKTKVYEVYPINILTLKNYIYSCMDGESIEVSFINIFIPYDDEQNKLTIQICIKDDNTPEKNRIFGTMTAERNNFKMRNILDKTLRMISGFCNINVLQYKIEYNLISFTIKNYNFITVKNGENVKHYKIQYCE